MVTIYDPERNMYVVVPIGYDLEFDPTIVYMTHFASQATKFTRAQAHQYIAERRDANPWLVERAEIRT